MGLVSVMGNDAIGGPGDGAKTERDGGTTPGDAPVLPTPRHQNIKKLHRIIVMSTNLLH